MTDKLKPGPKPKPNPEIEGLKQDIAVLFQKVALLTEQMKALEAAKDSARQTIAAARAAYNRHM